MNLHDLFIENGILSCAILAHVDNCRYDSLATRTIVLSESNRNDFRKLMSRAVSFFQIRSSQLVQGLLTLVVKSSLSISGTENYLLSCFGFILN